MRRPRFEMYGDSRRWIEESAVLALSFAIALSRAVFLMLRDEPLAASLYLFGMQFLYVPVMMLCWEALRRRDLERQRARELKRLATQIIAEADQIQAHWRDMEKRADGEEWKREP